MRRDDDERDVRPAGPKGPKRLKFVYGPVPSRRLGRSLGVSPVPRKTCSYSCVYCQLGPTTRPTIERRSFFPKDDILAEIVSAVPESSADYVTFSGDGEPTLCRDLGWLIGRCKAEFAVPVAVITNGSLLHLPEVRADLLEADVVMPSLDAGSPAVFRQINRPHRDLRYEQIVEGLVTFRKECGGTIWLEVMLVGDVNTSTESLKDLKGVLDRVQPDQVHLTVPIRPPAEKWVRIPSPSAIHAAREVLGQGRAITGYESGDFGTPTPLQPEQVILETCQRHPLREHQAEELARALGAPGLAAALVQAGKLKRATHGGKSYLLLPGGSEKERTGPPSEAQPA
jgi:wyosine [tRNA(Phe)-imidazoG37] synthetase (radical SAM superfamily)